MSAPGMNFIDALRAVPSPLRGSGVNHEGEHFSGRLVLRSLVGGSAVLLHYTATRSDGQHLHEEVTLLGVNADQVLCLWPVMEEIPFVLPHPLLSQETRPDGSLRGVFASGPRDAAATFREEITIEIRRDGALVLAHAWGLPDGGFEDRSSCVLVAADD